MQLDNYRDLSTSSNDLHAGFQFEFYCMRCKDTWRSPFRPYRLGQLGGWMQSLSFLFSGMRQVGGGVGLASASSLRGAKEAALQEARELAANRYVVCGGCHQGVCLECYDNSAGSCVDCSAGRNAARGAEVRQPAANACPGCGSAADGGRFCPECGFDRASTHKSCPGCGVMVARQARFCTDCGHAF